MKKIRFFALLCSLVIVLAPIMMLFSGCKKVNNGDTLFVNIELNSADATWSEAWVAKNGTKEMSYVVNRYSYSSWISHLPTAEDMTAPSGKVFAGWYFDSACTPGNSYTLYNWEQKAIYTAKPTSINAYAKWIDADTINIILDLDSTEAKFVESGLKSSEILINKTEIDSVLELLPGAEDVALTNSTLAGWSVENKIYKREDSTTIATAEDLSEKLKNVNYYTLYPVWNYGEDMFGIYYYVDSPSKVTAELNYDHYIEYYQKYGIYEHPYSLRTVNWGSKMIACCYFASDDISLIKSYSPTMNDIIVTNSWGKDVTSKYKIVGYKINYDGTIYDWTDDFIATHFEISTAKYPVMQTFSVYIQLGKA